MKRLFARGRRFLAAGVALVVIAGFMFALAASSASATGSFLDLDGSEWFATAVQALADQGVMFPQPDGAFDPSDPVTRAELAGYLTRILQLPLDSTSPFSDVDHYSWCAGYVGAMHDAGLILGTTDTTFSPDLPVSRQQAATFIMRALRYYLSKQNQTDAIGAEPTGEDVGAWLAGYRDRELIADSHAGAVADAYRLRIMQGGEDGWFFPSLTVSRAQIAVMLYRAFDQPLSPSPVYPVELAPTSSYATQSIGSEGPLVLLLESRLAELHYPCGTVDTVYDECTRDAVMAFEKVEGLHRDGVADSQVWEHLFAAQTPMPKLSEGGDRIEVDLSRQVMFVIRGGAVAEVVHVSTGKRGTPTGHGKIWLKQAGWQHCPVGWMYYPSYFWPSIAIHGSSSVPPYPASHGCVRTPIWIAAHIFDELPMGMSVDVYY